MQALLRNTVIGIRAMKFLKNSSVRTNLFLLPLITGFLFFILLLLFLNFIKNENELLKHIEHQNLTKVSTLWDLFIKLSENHADLISLLVSTVDNIDEEQIYTKGKSQLYKLHDIHEQTRLLTDSYIFNESEQRRIARLLSRLKEYKSESISAIEMASVDLSLASEFMIKANNRYVNVNNNFLGLLEATEKNTTNLIRNSTEQFATKSTTFVVVSLVGIVILVCLGVYSSFAFKEILREQEWANERVTQAKLELEKANRTLEDRVQERTTALQASNRELEAFSYSVSHDLRAPLRSIDGFSQALLEDYNDKLDATGKNYLERVRAASQRMARLIDDLLQLSRLTRGEMNYEPVDLSQLVQSISSELKERQPERRVDFVIKEELVAQGDVRLLRVVLENLLGNAFKFTGMHPSAVIEFGSVPHNGKSAYYVRDDGAGFDMVFSDKLFGAFQRLHGATEFEGTGIGLATVQRIIHRHGGLIWAESAVEKGATFYFTL